jgi:hypothetical protein
MPLSRLVTSAALLAALLSASPGASAQPVVTAGPILSPTP